MDNIAQAILTNGKRIQYVIKENPPRGGMKYTYFSPDNSYVIQFFNNKNITNDINTKRRLEAIIGKYNPTLSEEEGGACGNTKEIAKYFLNKFCWPIGIVEYPELGIVCPAYPSNYFFDESSSEFLELKNKDKRSNWFTSRNRRFLNVEELGDFSSMLKISQNLARTIRRMHQAGLAHSDLSCNNILIDPKIGSCVVIDIDSLVVPNIFPPEVIGTYGYIAPELVETLHNESCNKVSPSIYTDLYSLAVLIYEYLLFRHPLMGPKIYSENSVEEDDLLALGCKATFIENPKDKSNRPKDLQVTIKDLGPFLQELFLKVFVDGLHNPNERPMAMEWEKGLFKTINLIQPCENLECAAKWFILYDLKNRICPFCKTKVSSNNFIRFKLKSQLRGKLGQWIEFGELNIYNNMFLYKWHMFANVFPDEKTEQSTQAYIFKFENKWIFFNKSLEQLILFDGTIIPKGELFELKNGMFFKTSNENNGLLIEVLFSN